jgi:hypothetical protein
MGEVVRLVAAAMVQVPLTEAWLLKERRSR